MKLKFEKLNNKNLNDCLKLKEMLFPESNSNQDYNKYFQGEIDCSYYVVYLKNKPCAITGFYDFDGKHENAFMGWFGVHPNFRKIGIGSKTFDFTLKQVKKQKYNYFRLYTDKIINSDSIKLYMKKGMTQEAYTYPDALGKTGNFVIFTKIIKSTGHDLWNNSPLNEDENYNLESIQN